MDATYRKVVLGAMLHDIGKLVQRADPGEGSHSWRGAEFVGGIIDRAQWSEVLDCIRYHHLSDIRRSGLNQNSIAYIIYEADNIAAGTDRRKMEAESVKRFDRDVPLYSVFNVFNESVEVKNTAYRLKTMKENLQINFPVEVDSGQAKADTVGYRQILDSFRYGLATLDLENDSPESLLKLLETHLAYVPSSTDISEIPDISLYNHLKMTAAISGCMFEYFKDNHITDYKKVCMEEASEIRDKSIFLLVSGEFSGIQSFIYTISSKGALKSLRGRSFYLEILLEHIIDEILSEAGLCRVNLIYSGGGHFYLLLPNTERIKNLLRDARAVFNDWLLRSYGTSLYLEIAWMEASPEELGNGLGEEIKTKNWIGMLFKNVAQEVSRKKLQRYETEQLRELMSPESSYHLMLENERECGVCGASAGCLEALRGGMDNELQVCPSCREVYMLGDQLPRLESAKEGELHVLSVKEMREDHGYNGLPSLKHDRLQLRFEAAASAEKGLRQKENRRVYSINRYLSGMNYSTNLWAGTYSVPSSGGEGLVDFETLAKKSKGIKRIGVLRADVDNLGQAFVSGFEKAKGSANPYQYISLTRYASLSYYLSMFFKFEINKLCGGKAGVRQFRLDRCGWDSSLRPRELVIVYSGGDDVFIAGAWNEVLEFAVDLRTSFRRFTNDKMTLSAGFGLFDHKFPISQMARITGSLEKQAKAIPGKDSIALFGLEHMEGQLLNRHTYQWDRFIDRVCMQKMKSLSRWLDVEQRGGTEKLFCGMSRLYKMLDLYMSIVNEWDKGERINVARLAYTLGRMEPSGREPAERKNTYREMKDTLYGWALSAEDRQELITALNLLIYYNREESMENE